ncbi:MAG: magnesium transporter [Verrucomicrobia bacterium]|nr:MAG: magnesium transporter [Verrucomicrobiota bacterium]
MHTAEGFVLWVELDGLSDIGTIQELGDRFGLHPLALEDVLNLGQRPKVEPYENHLFIVSQMISDEENGDVSGEQVCLFLGPGFLLSIQEDPSTDTFLLVHERLRTARGLIRKMGADYLSYALMDAVIDHKFPLLEKLGEALDELDDEVVSKPSIEHVHQLHDCKRLLSHLRRYVWPEREVINALLHDESGLIRRETKIYLRDCYDHTVQIMDLIESYRDVATANMDMYLSSVGMRTNEIMRVLTVISSIFIPLTFLAGVWGMNFQGEKDGQTLPFNMPELHHPLGYPLCLALMLAIAIVQVIYFRRKKWI